MNRARFAPALLFYAHPRAYHGAPYLFLTARLSSAGLRAPLFGVLAGLRAPKTHQGKAKARRDIYALPPSKRRAKSGEVARARGFFVEYLLLADLNDLLRKRLSKAIKKKRQTNTAEAGNIIKEKENANANIHD
ncbi:hypothetical protein [Sulfuricurvum sp.]|uniref:hypothetical protein n=1 Tax=Sulfuricurvum sp. TaxID=2025608 RepID=UPI002639E0D0|nr:hypothetical protein [Sulfuricurvum sp.]MDD2267888.1 hypothetical protein [Sulfuricurvum sp.]